MLAIIINALTIICGSLIGLLVKKRTNDAVSGAVMTAIGLFTIYIGISGFSNGVNAVVYLLSIVLGGLIGTLLDFEGRVEKAALIIQYRLSAAVSNDDGENRFAMALTSFFVISCVGAYTLLAAFNAGLGDNTMLYTKAVMDFAVSLVMAASLGIGVLFAVIPIILFEILLVSFSSFLSGVMSSCMIEAFSCMGSILTFAIGIDVAGIKKIKVINYVPALLFAPIIAYLFERIS